MRRIAAGTALATLALGCTHDYDALRVGGGAASSSAASSSSANGGGGGGGVSTVGSGGMTGGPAGAGGTASGGAGTGGAPPACGDGTAEAAEECDDGNSMSGDGCSDACTVECTGQGEVLDPSTLHCYFVGLTPIIWQDASDACTAMPEGWDLAAPSTPGELAFLASQVPQTHYFWLGGNDFDREGTFAWTNGEAWTYADGVDPWESTMEPNDAGGAEDCVRTNAGGMKLNDDGCHKWANGPDIGHVCERPPAGKL